MNKGALRGTTTKRVGPLSTSSKALAASGDWADQIIVSNPGGPATLPVNSLGTIGDSAVHVIGPAGVGSREYAALVGPKAASVGPNNGWPSSFCGGFLTLPWRSSSFQPADLQPGWAVFVQNNWATGTVPADLTRTGAFASTAWESSAAGTKAYLGRYRAGSDECGMAFFSAAIRLSVLPEATRYAWIGQLVLSGSTLYGYGARIDSAGGVALVLCDFGLGAGTVLDSGMTYAVNETLVVERFGHQMQAFRAATDGYTTYTPDDATSAKRPLRAAVGRNLYDLGVEAYASGVAGSSIGYATDSASVRVSQMRFAG